MWVGGGNCLNRGLSRMTRILRVSFNRNSLVLPEGYLRRIRQKVDDGVRGVHRFGAKRWGVLLLSYLD